MFRVLYTIKGSEDLLSITFVGDTFAQVICKFMAETNLNEDSIYSIRKID